jgi:2-amino-4-hydroxy-6-hydroxymethyldihydropteridine diphosphokinase
MERVYLGLGSNVGDSAKILASAFAELRTLLSEPRISSLYRSRARYVEDQADFLNAAVCGFTELEPRALLDAVNRIEARFGRDRTRETLKGPRSLDIDILLYGRRIVVEEGLILPHPGMRERKFVLLPLLELDPGLSDPATDSPFAAVLASLPAQGIYLIPAGVYDRLYQ